MRKCIALLLLAFLSCASLSAAPRAVMEWLMAFEAHAVDHDEASLCADMEARYLQEQCMAFHEGNKARFLAEFFCGLDAEENYLCPGSITEIQDIRFMGMRKVKGQGYEVTYQVGIEGKGLLERKWLLHTRGKEVLGLEGARG